MLNQKKIDLLDSIGFIWNIRKQKKTVKWYVVSCADLRGPHPQVNVMQAAGVMNSHGPVNSVAWPRTSIKKAHHFKIPSHKRTNYFTAILRSSLQIIHGGGCRLTIP